MKCPYCGFGQDRVVDSRESKEADAIRRRRECERCNRRFTTYERIDEIPYMVVKKDGRRERFDRQKVLSGLLRASEKRPISSVQLESIVDAAESFLIDAPERERTTSEIGELISELHAAYDDRFSADQPGYENGRLPTLASDRPSAVHSSTMLSQH